MGFVCGCVTVSDSHCVRTSQLTLSFFSLLVLGLARTLKDWVPPFLTCSSIEVGASLLVTATESVLFAVRLYKQYLNNIFTAIFILNCYE